MGMNTRTISFALLGMAVALLGPISIARADCSAASCNATYSGECGSVTYGCKPGGTYPNCIILEDQSLGVQSVGGGVQQPRLPICPEGQTCTCPSYCGVVSQNYSSSSTACTADTIACTVDHCSGSSTACYHDPDDTLCPADAANHRHGVCGATGCVFQCDSGYKACGGTCIPSTSCCNASECTTPPNGCYMQQGTCNGSQVCVYTKTDGAKCDADGNACTVGDKCVDGACVKGPTKTCIKKPCEGPPTCNTSTGTCDAVVLTNGSACGGAGDTCTPAGTCTAGMCSSATKDCSSLTAVCKVGICDGTQPAATNCTTTDVANDMPCTINDKCQTATKCNGGECVGTPMVCPPSGPCRMSACAPSSGLCVETIAPAGSSCASAGSCLQNATCDASGVCSGDPVLDGTPCDKEGCSMTAACVSGACTCLDQPDLSVDPKSGMTGDLGLDQPGGDCDCDLTRRGRHGAGGAALVVLVLLGLALRRRSASFT